MNSQIISVSKGSLWAGRVMSALVVLLMIFSAVMKLMKSEMAVKGFADSGIAEALIIPIGILELSCALIYAIPKTTVLGAILLTGYLGGAVMICLKANQPWFPAVIVGIIAWGGLFLRDVRVRSLLPITK